MTEISLDGVDQLFFSLEGLFFDAPAGLVSLNVKRLTKLQRHRAQRSILKIWKSKVHSFLILRVSPTFSLYASEFKTLPKHLDYPLKFKSRNS